MTIYHCDKCGRNGAHIENDDGDVICKCGEVLYINETY